jgi:hypothetical protein
MKKTNPKSRRLVRGCYWVVDTASKISPSLQYSYFGVRLVRGKK